MARVDPELLVAAFEEPASYTSPEHRVRDMLDDTATPAPHRVAERRSRRAITTVARVSHTTTITVRFADLDPYDHVNHARYLTYFESARIEMLDEVGYGMSRMKEEGFQIVLVEVAVRFHAPAGLHDVLTITTDLIEAGRASTRWRQSASCRERLVAELEARAAFTDPHGRPTRPPSGFVEAVTVSQPVHEA